MKRHVALLTLFSMFTICAHAQNPRRDGNWWINNGETLKLAYVTGFFDGMELGDRFSYWGLDHSKKDSCAPRAVESYNSMMDKFFANVTNDQLVEGLDKFYSDFRNRSIKVHDGVWLIVNEIAGTPQKEIDEMIEKWRQNADKD